MREYTAKFDFLTYLLSPDPPENLEVPQGLGVEKYSCSGAKNIGLDDGLSLCSILLHHPIISAQRPPKKAAVSCGSRLTRGSI